MKQVLLPFVLLTLWPAAAYQGCTAKQSTSVLDLCHLVDNWKDYHGKEVRVRAVYRVGPEQTWLFDPACRNGEGLTDVSFRANAKGPLKKLDQLVGEDKQRRVWVVFAGVFYGPEPYGNAAGKLPGPLKERFENAPRRYGHMGMESKIEVSRVVEITKVVGGTVDEQGNLHPQILSVPCNLFSPQTGFVGCAFLH